MSPSLFIAPQVLAVLNYSRTFSLTDVQWDSWVVLIIADGLIVGVGYAMARVLSKRVPLRLPAQLLFAGALTTALGYFVREGAFVGVNPLPTMFPTLWLPDWAIGETMWYAGWIVLVPSLFIWIVTGRKASETGNARK